MFLNHNKVKNTKVLTEKSMSVDDYIHNFYEKIVIEEIIKRELHNQYNEDIIADFCCTVLN